MLNTFRSLAIRNYRVWAAGAIISNVGTWMQRTAQDWLVLTQLTHNNATAVGVVMALQFGPQLVLFPITGAVVDRFSRRRVLMATQLVMGALALALGLLTITHLVQLWQVDIFALLLGITAAFDAPARQTFVNELVAGPYISNAVALNSTSFNIARMIGPAVAGVLIAVVGTGWVFLLNAATYVAVLASLYLIRVAELHSPRIKGTDRTGLGAGFRYVWEHREIRATLLVIFLIGTFGLNFPIFLSTMNVSIFHANSAAYGLLTTIMALGSVAGALQAARLDRPRMTFLLTGSALFAISLTAAAFLPNYWLFAFMLIIVGVSAQTVTTSANSLVQLAVPPHMRGRVMAIYMALAMGGTPIGAPIVGLVADSLGPQWGLLVGAASGVASAVVVGLYLVKHRNLHLARGRGYLPHMVVSPTRAITLPVVTTSYKQNGGGTAAVSASASLPD